MRHQLLLAQPGRVQVRPLPPLDQILDLAVPRLLAEDFVDGRGGLAAGCGAVRALEMVELLLVAV